MCPPSTKTTWQVLFMSKLQLGGSNCMDYIGIVFQKPLAGAKVPGTTMYFLRCCFYSFLKLSLNKPCFLLGMRPHTMIEYETKRNPQRDEANGKLFIVQLSTLGVLAISFLTSLQSREQSGLCEKKCTTQASLTMYVYLICSSTGLLSCKRVGLARGNIQHRHGQRCLPLSFVCRSACSPVKMVNILE